MGTPVSRQRFLRGAAGAVAAAALSSCRSPAHGDPTPTPSAPPDWAALDAELGGGVTVPPDPGYGAAKAVFNARFDASTPAAVVRPTSVDDVRRAVAYASDRGVRIAVRSGGHSYVGASAADGSMVVDLRGLPDAVGFDDRTGLATIPAAAQLDSVQTALASYGRTVPTGSCPSVGAAGLTLGGGLGATSRRWGLTCDALTAATVVLPGGDLVTASAADHTDLFWALRGGAGSVGVVTSLTLRSNPFGDRDVVTLVFPGGATADVVTGWNTWLRGADRSIWGMVNVTAGSDAAGATVVLATAAGDGGARGRELAAATGVHPTSQSVRTLAHMDFVHYFEGGSGAARPRAFVAGSDVIGDLTHDAADAVVAALASWPVGVGAATAIVESLSGAVGDVAPDASAFPWRRHAACIQWYTEPVGSEATAAATTWLSSAHQAVQDHSVGGYANYLETDTPASRYFGANVTRLNEIRRTYDPRGLLYTGLRF